MNPLHTTNSSSSQSAVPSEMSPEAFGSSDLQQESLDFQVGPLANAFILHFGQMGSSWGVNRTVGQMYALLFLAPRPLHADEIAAALKISRSNVSMGIKELSSWGIITVHNYHTDRRDYFASPNDIWLIFRRLAQEHKKREIDPTLSMLRTALMQTPSSASEVHAQQRMKSMYEFMEQMSGWFDQVHDMQPDVLVRMMNMGMKIKKFMSYGFFSKSSLPASSVSSATGAPNGIAQRSMEKSSSPLTQAPLQEETMEQIPLWLLEEFTPPAQLDQGRSPLPEQNTQNTQNTFSPKSSAEESSDST